MLLNQVQIAGNLTRDPEVRAAGQAEVVKLGLACNERYTNPVTGQVTDRAVFVDVDGWKAVVAYCKEAGLKKGDHVVVTGKLNYSEWADQSGVRRTKVGITAFAVARVDRPARRQEAGQQPGGDGQQEQPQQERQPALAGAGVNGSGSFPSQGDEEIPY